VVNLLALALEQHGQTPTHWQHTRYPDWARPSIRVIPEGAKLDICKPDPQARKQPFAIGEFTVAPHEKLVTYVARNLEPYRGCHILMRALPDLLAARPDLKVIMVGGDDVSYGAKIQGSTWREHFLKELKGQFDESGVLLPGQVAYEVYLQLLQRSDVHVYLTYPFVASWSLREAMACGCAIIASDVESVGEFVTDGKTGLLVPCLDAKNLARTVLNLLEDDKLNKRLRAGARKYAEQHLDLNDTIKAQLAIIKELTKS
jgi:glycosyltransferase involved in cell wall biosynthesis